MLNNVPKIFAAVGYAAAVFLANAAQAQDGSWQVRKSSGDVWITSAGAQQISLNGTSNLSPGDTIQTGRSGRVLLVRGNETILISGNSVVGLPAKASDGLSTTVTQRAGSILLDVEKKNVKHFEVQTPYLAAVVKGTQFRVTITPSGSKVSVTRGRVDVADFKTGQLAVVLPGQAANVSSIGKGSLSLTGRGALTPIQRGEPRASTVRPVAVPAGGLRAPAAVNGDRRASVSGRVTNLSGTSVREMRIKAPLGEVKLNVEKATRGLAHSAATPGDTVWNNGKLNPGNGASAAGAKDFANGSGAGGPLRVSGADAAAAPGGPAGAAAGPGGGPGNSGNGNVKSGPGGGSDKDKDKDKPDKGNKGKGKP